MEYLPHSLQDWIDHIRKRKIINKGVAEQFLKASVLVNLWLQQQSLCHCDIKPHNILINDLQQPTEFKLCDFDNLMHFTSKQVQNCYYSTQSYHPPEIQHAIGQGLEQFKYNPFKAQVYSLGLCLV